MLFRDRLEVWNPGELPPSLAFEDLRKPHASIPRNPLIAEPMYLTRHIERAGTGILDMIGLCKTAGLRPPKFHQSGGQFIQTIWRPKPVAGGPSGGLVGGLVGGPVEPKSITVMRAILAAPLSISELVRSLEMNGRTGALRLTLTDLIADGMVEHTIPDAPTSRLQKYRLTAKGQEGLKGPVKSQRGAQEEPKWGPSGAQVEPKSGAQVETQSLTVMKAIYDAPLSGSELLHALNMKSRTGALKQTLADLMAEGLIEHTIPDKPTSRLQKYRLTAKGRGRMAKG